MGMVALTYKVMPDSDVEDVSADEIVEQIMALKDETYDVQLCETKPLAFGLKFIQVHVVMNDGSGLSDVFEDNMRGIRGTGEIIRVHQATGISSQNNQFNPLKLLICD